MTNLQKIRAIIVTAVFAAVLGGFFLLNRIIAPPAISEAERRPLKTLPELSWSEISHGRFMSGFEEYAEDSFAFRDFFRSVRAASVMKLFLQSDKDGLYYKDGHAGKLQTINEDSFLKAGDKIKKIADTLDAKGLNVYYSFIPDKSVYAIPSAPGFDVELAMRLLSQRLEKYTYIDLSSSLAADSFYKTDLHWDQSKLRPVVERLAADMGFTERINLDFAETYAGDFRGVYYGQLAMPMPRDRAVYLSNACEMDVRYWSATTLDMIDGELYYPDALSGMDPYNFFLNGVQPLVEIANPNASTDRELYLFRDSFGASLAPLLVSAYAKITLIDLRLLDSRALTALIDFKEGSDALFMYSSQVLNNSGILMA